MLLQFVELRLFILNIDLIIMHALIKNKGMIFLMSFLLGPIQKTLFKHLKGMIVSETYKILRLETFWTFTINDFLLLILNKRISQKFIEHIDYLILLFLR